MKIRIKAEKVMRANLKFYKILSVIALGESCLPREYLDGFPRCVFTTVTVNELEKCPTREFALIFLDKESCSSPTIICEGSLWSKENINYVLSLAKQCAERLDRINTWKGEETFEI